MLKINFDLFYELRQGSVISSTSKNTVKYWRIVDGNLQFKTVIDNQVEHEWQISDSITFPVDGIFQIEKRFERFSNG